MSQLRRNRLRELLRKGEPTLGTHVVSTWPDIIEIIGLTGMIHYVEFVSQYGPYDLYALENLSSRADLHNMSTIIKIDAEPMTYLAQKAVGAGFQGILFADLRTLDDVERAIQAVRSEPGGHNGCFSDRGHGFGLVSAKDLVKHYDDIVVAIMMEKKSLYAQLEDVMNLDGIDMVQFGACDFAMSIGKAGDEKNPVVLEAERNVIKMAVKYDKHPRPGVNGSPEEIKKALSRYTQLGVHDFVMGFDTDIIFNWLSTSGSLVRQFLKIS